jgi:K+-sensing histidine kinase KdpD
MPRPARLTGTQAIGAGSGGPPRPAQGALAGLRNGVLAARHALGRVNPYVGSFGLAVGAIMLAVPVNMITHVSGLTRVFLLAVLISAATYGLWPALFASLISIVLYDFFFLNPIYSLSISSTEDIVNVCLFFLTAVVVSVLAARVRRHAVAADLRALTAEKLSVFARALAAVLTVDELTTTAAKQSAALLSAPVVVLLPEDGTLVQHAAHPARSSPNPAAWQAAVQAWPTFLRSSGGVDRTLPAFLVCLFFPPPPSPPAGISRRCVPPATRWGSLACRPRHRATACPPNGRSCSTR